MLHAVSSPAIVSLQAEDSSFQPILPQEDIAQMYQRILDTEIAVAGGDQAQSNSNGTASKAGSSAQNLKLAAAMGLTQLMLPFRFSYTMLSTSCILYATPPPFPPLTPNSQAMPHVSAQQHLVSPVSTT